VTEWDNGAPDDQDERSDPGPEAEGASPDHASEEPQAEAQPQPGTRYPWEVQLSGSEEEPQTNPEPWQPPAPDAADDGGVKAASTGVKALLTAMAFLLVMLLVVGALALKLWYDRMAAQDALMASTRAMSLTMSPRLSGPMSSRLENIEDAISRGRFVEATSRLDNILRGANTGAGQGFEGPDPSQPFPSPGLQPPGQAPGGIGGPRGRPGGPGGPGGPGRPGQGPGAGPGPQAQMRDLPPETAEFLKKNPRIANLVGQANMMGVKLKESGGDVTQLRKIRDAIFEAARLHDKAAVLKGLKDFQQEFGKEADKAGLDVPRPGGQRPRGARPQARRPRAPKEPPRAFMTLAQRCGKALREAQAEGKDVRKAIRLMQQSETAARAGHFPEATKLARAALKELKHAGKLPPQPQLFRNPVVRTLLELINVEDKDIGSALQGMREAYEVAKANTIDKAAEALRAGIETLENVGKRRRAISKQLEQVRSGAVKPPSREEMQARMQAQMQARMEQLRGTVGNVLAQAQEMTPEEFAENQNKLIDALLAAVFPPQPGTKPEQVPPGPEPGTAPEPDLPTEQRVREKMLEAAEPYLQVKADPEQKELAEDLADLFRRARELLAKREYDEAELLVDRGLALLGIGLPDEATNAFAPRPDTAPSSSLSPILEPTDPGRIEMPEIEMPGALDDAPVLDAGVWQPAPEAPRGSTGAPATDE